MEFRKEESAYQYQDPSRIKKCTIFSTQWLEKKKGSSASQLFLFEYLDFMQYVSNSRRKILHTNIKIPHELKMHDIFNSMAGKER